MSSESDPQGVIEELRQEVIRLQNELAESTRERDQAAEYGLAVLAEKSDLQQKLEDLEVAYESAKHELDCATEVSVLGDKRCDDLSVFQSNPPFVVFPGLLTADRCTSWYDSVDIKIPQIP